MRSQRKGESPSGRNAKSIFFFSLFCCSTGYKTDEQGVTKPVLARFAVPLSCCRADEEATESDRQTVNFGIIAAHSLVTAMDEALKTLGFPKKDCETIKFCEKWTGNFSAHRPEATSTSFFLLFLPRQD